MTGSTFSPTTWRDVDSTKAQPNTQGFKGTCSANTTQSTDFLIPDDNLIRQIEFMANGVTFGDKVSLSVVDKDAVYFPANTVIASPVNNFNCVADSQRQADYEAVTPQKILGGLYIRVSYTNTSLLSTVSYGINIIMMKVLL